MPYQREFASNVRELERPFSTRLRLVRTRPFVVLDSEVGLQYERRDGSKVLKVAVSVLTPVAREGVLQKQDSHERKFFEHGNRVSVLPIGISTTKGKNVVYVGDDYKISYIEGDPQSIDINIASRKPISVATYDTDEDVGQLLRKVHPSRPRKISRGTPIQTELQELLTSSHPLDILVDRLRKGRFANRLGYVPPILLDRPLENLPPEFVEAARRYLIIPDNFASAMFNYSFRSWPGTISNLKIIPTRIDSINSANDFLQIKNEFIAPDSVVSFLAQADLISLGGQKQGEVKREYALYTTKEGVRIGAPQHLLDQVQLFYPGVDFRNTRVVWLASKTRDSTDTKQAIRSSRAIVDESIKKGRKIEGAAVFHPAQGGLPSLGKDK